MDEDRVQRLKAGDVDEWGDLPDPSNELNLLHLKRGLLGRLYENAYYLLGDYNDAKDAVMDTAEVIIHKLGKYDGRGLNSWAGVICRNLIRKSAPRYKYNLRRQVELLLKGLTKYPRDFRRAIHACIETLEDDIERNILEGLCHQIDTGKLANWLSLPASAIPYLKAHALITLSKNATFISVLDPWRQRITLVDNILAELEQLDAVSRTQITGEMEDSGHELTEEYVEGIIVGVEGGGSTKASDMDKQLDFFKAFDGLPERDKQVLQLLADGYSQKAIAMKMLTEPSTAGVWIHRARQQLRRQWQEAGYAVGDC